MASDPAGLISTDITSSVNFQAYGPVPMSARKDAAELMARISDSTPEPLTHARLKIKRDDERPPAQVVLVEARVEVSGIPLRAESTGPTSAAALQDVGDRLSYKLADVPGSRRRHKSRPPSIPPGRWKISDLPGSRPGFRHRPPERRSIMRRKTYSPDDRCSVYVALSRLQALDYRWFIFTDEADDRTTIVYDEGKGPTVCKADGSTPDAGSIHPGIEVVTAEAPAIAIAEAVSRLNESDETFIFFTGVDLHGVSVLYRRYDGHYGLMESRANV